MSASKFLKRPYEREANFDNALVQGTSQPHNRLFGHHDSESTKRRKTNALKFPEMTDSYKDPWNPLRVSEQHETTWRSGTEPFSPVFRALHPRGNNYFPASMSSVSESSWSQDLSENSYLLESDKIKGRREDCLPFRGLTPTTGPRIIASGPSPWTEYDDVKSDLNKSIAASSYAVAFMAQRVRDSPPVTWNADWFCDRGLRNNGLGYSANATSDAVSCHNISGQFPSSEMLLEGQATHPELLQERFGCDSSSYDGKFDRVHEMPYTERLSSPYCTSISGPDWNQPRNQTMMNGGRISTSMALATTPVKPLSTNPNSLVCNDNIPLDQLNPYLCQGRMPAKMNYESSNQIRSNNFHYAGPFSQEHIASRTRILLEVSIGSIPAITQTSYPVEVTNNIAGNPTDMGPQIEVPQRAQSENPTGANTSRKKRGRQGGLGRERGQKVHTIRKIHACFHCWARKTPCSEGMICERCEDSKYSMSPRLCVRTNLKDYYKMFFPSLLVSALKTKTVEQLPEHISGNFYRKKFRIWVTCGPHFSAMELNVAEFTPRIKDFMTVPLVTPHSGGYTFTDQKPAPVALRELQLDPLVMTCKNHAGSMMKQLVNFAPTKKDEIDNIPYKLLQIFSRYHAMQSPTSNRELLKNALMLYSIHYFIGRRITYAGDSITKISHSLTRPAVNTWDSNLVSHLLNRQIKCAMQKLRKQITREILEELEQELRSKSKRAWATCFSVIVIICICIEEGQIAMNGILMHKRKFEPTEAPSADRVIEACHELDARLFRHMVELFHAVFKTQKYPPSNKKDSVFNPVRDGLEDEGDDEVRRDCGYLVDEVQQILQNHEDALETRAGTPSFNSGDTLTDHMNFRDSNSARLVATFLLSFR